ncbi:MAG: regulatory protein RecX [Clostridia bacterium]|nr:regulatory protein RecX [Clostridia bacterium]
MIITTEQTKHGKISVYADGELALLTDAAFWYSLGIYDEDDLPQERIEEIIAEDERRKCCAAAYKFLSVRAYSERDTRRKLAAKYSADAIDYAVERATELGLIDDEELAQTLAEDYLRLRHYAPERIRLELQKKGIDRNAAQAAAALLAFDAREEIQYLLETKFRHSLGDDTGIRRTAAALSRMGYTYSEIRSALSDVVSDEVFTDE